MLDELAKLLVEAARRAQERAAEQQRGGRPQPPLGAQTAGEADRSPDLLDAELVDEDVAEHVAEHLDTADYARRAAQLGRGVREEETRIERHIGQAFDDKLLRRRREREQAVRAGGPLIQWLQSPENLVRAIIVNEVLQRPEHRW